MASGDSYALGPLVVSLHAFPVTSGNGFLGLFSIFCLLLVQVLDVFYFSAAESAKPTHELWKAGNLTEVVPRKHVFLLIAVSDFLVHPSLGAAGDEDEVQRCFEGLW